jgi:hypothetical protein
MEIQLVQSQSPNSKTEFVILKVSGSLDSENEVVKRARELVASVNSGAMLKSFDDALEKGDVFGAARKV